ncbi:MAG: mechanosensitive ion channel domain-containing protein [Acidobacteriota bacterium]
MQTELQDIGQQATGLVRAVLDYRLVQIAGKDVFVHSLLVFLLILTATFILSRLIQRAIGRVLRKTGIEEKGSLAVIRRLLHYSIVAVGLTTGLATLGFDLAALFAAGAIFAVAIGFAMQNIAQNFVSGVILLVERSIKPHDVLGFQGEMVRVMSMGIRSTIVRTLDGEDLIVPNTELAQAVVTNYTLRDPLCRLRVPVGVAYDSDIRSVHRVLESAAEKVPWRSQKQAPAVLLTGFGASSVDFEVSVWIDQPWTSSSRRSDLHHVVWEALADAGVVIAFPQLDVHLDPVEVMGATEGAPHGSKPG